MNINDLILKSSLVDINWLDNNKDHPQVIILDVSMSNNVSNIKPQFPDLKIRGAIYFDMKNIFRDKENPIPNMMPSPKSFQIECRLLGINNNSVIIIYDNLGIYHSPRAWWMFKVMGYQQVAVLNGGLTAWKNEELPTSAYYGKIGPIGDFISNYQSHLIIDKDSILSILNNTNIETSMNNSMKILDARSSDRFSGESAEPRGNMNSGHIPTSINLPYKTILDNGHIKPNAELEKIFDSNIDYKDDLIFSCGSGVTACILILASDQINNNKMTLYDGSWSEWGIIKK